MIIVHPKTPLENSTTVSNQNEDYRGRKERAVREQEWVEGWWEQTTHHAADRISAVKYPGDTHSCRMIDYHINNQKQHFPYPPKTEPISSKSKNAGSYYSPLIKGIVHRKWARTIQAASGKRVIPHAKVAGLNPLQKSLLPLNHQFTRQGSPIVPWWSLRLSNAHTNNKLPKTVNVQPCPSYGKSASWMKR